MSDVVFKADYKAGYEDGKADGYAEGRESMECECEDRIQEAYVKGYEEGQSECIYEYEGDRDPNLYYLTTSDILRKFYLNDVMAAHVLTELIERYQDGRIIDRPGPSEEDE